MFWGESDNFEKLQKRELGLEQVKEDCAHGDYVRLQRLDEVMMEEESNAMKLSSPARKGMRPL